MPLPTQLLNSPPSFVASSGATSGPAYSGASGNNQSTGSFNVGGAASNPLILGGLALAALFLFLKFKKS